MMSSLSDERRSEITLTNITTSDCGVIAIQAITGMARPEAEAVAIEKAGYKPGFGIMRGNLNRALKDLGYEIELVATERDGFTVATFAVDHEYGVYLLYTERHVMGMIEGAVHNGRSEWHAPLEVAYRLKKSSEV